MTISDFVNEQSAQEESEPFVSTLANPYSDITDNNIVESQTADDEYNNYDDDEQSDQSDIDDPDWDDDEIDNDNEDLIGNEWKVLTENSIDDVRISFDMIDNELLDKVNKEVPEVLVL